MEVSLDSQSVKGLAMEADCSPPSRQARGPRTTGGRQPALPRSRALDRPHGCTLARSSRPIRALEFCLPALPPLDFEGGVRVKALSGDPDFEYAIIDGTIVRVHQHGTGAKGGLEIRPLAGREVA
jgi:hypothetical protein